MLAVAEARASSDNDAICYVFPVLWMTSERVVDVGAGVTRRSEAWLTACMRAVAKYNCLVLSYVQYSRGHYQQSLRLPRGVARLSWPGS